MCVISEKCVKIRKPCYCWGCGRPFAVGDIVLKVTWKDLGRLEDIPWCDVCDRWWREEADQWTRQDGISEGLLRDEYPELYPDGDENWRGGPTRRPRGATDGE